MLGIAAGVQRELTDFTGVYVVVLLDVVCAPWAQVVVDQRARPLVQVLLVVPWVEVEVAELAVFCDDLGDGAAAI